MSLIFIPLAAVGLAWWLSARVRDRRARIAACPEHRFEYVSLYDRGRPGEWIKICASCPFQEPVRDREVAERLTREYVRDRGRKGR